MNSEGIFTRLVRECLRFPGRLVLIVTGLLSLGAGQLYLTWIAKLWAEGPLLSGDRAAMAALALKAALTSVTMMAGLFVSRYLLNSVNQRMVERLRNQAQQCLLALEVPAIRRFQSGELMSRIFNDAGALSGFVREILRRLIGETIVIAGAVAMLFYLDWPLALLAVVMAPAVALLLSRVGRVIRRTGMRAQEEIGVLSALLSEQLMGVTTIKGFRAEAAEQRRFARQDARYRHQVMRGEWWSAILMTSIWLITALGLLLAVWYGSDQVAAGRLTTGGLLAFCLYAVQTAEPVRRLSEVQGLLQRAIAAGARLFEITDLPFVERDGTAALSAEPGGELRIERVHFRYRADKPVLEDFSLRLGGRETVALVAASGGGKSTLAALLLRFRDPERGAILLDGIDLRQLRLAELRRVICVAEQEPFVFSAPLVDNIRYGRPQASREQVEAAAALAGLEPLVRSLPGGLEGALAEGGRNLSGGQKQRIALARIIVRDPAVLVLDEATNALDSDTERQLFTQLEAWLARRTVLVMAHRLSTISRFRRVVVLENGRSAGDGTVDELLAGCPAFSRLFAEQLTPLGEREKARLLA